MPTRARHAIDPLEQVDASILDMGALAHGMLHDGFAAVQSGNRYLAAGLRDQAANLAGMDESIETGILDAIGAGVDPETARQLLVRVKLITYLNRVGRYGFDIARVLEDVPHLAPGSFTQVGRVVADVESMLGIVLQALERGASPDLDKLLVLEDSVDLAQVRAMSEWPSAGRDAAALQRILIVRSLERCADNLCKAAEKLHYAATGQRVLLR